VYDGTYWRVVAPYTNTYDRVRNSNSVKALKAIARAKIIVSNGSGYFPVASGETFNIAYAILYATSAISVGATGTTTYISYPSVALTNTKSGVSLTAQQRAYIVGTLNEITDTNGNVLATGVLYTVDPAVFVNAPDVYEGEEANPLEGKYMIPVGTCYDATHVYFEGGVPTLYAYKDNVLVRYPSDDIYTVSVTQENHTSSITNLTTGQIALQANYQNVQENYTYLNGQVDTIASDVETQTGRIDVLSEQISLKVSSSDVSTMLDARTGQMKTDITNLQNSALTINSEGITSLVSRVDNLEQVNESTAFKVQSDGAYVYYGTVDDQGEVTLNQADYTKIDQQGQHVYHNSQEVAWNTYDGTGSPKMSIGNSSSDAQRWTFSMDGDLLNIRWIDS
jgi:hypothetical protein